MTSIMATPHNIEAEQAVLGSILLNNDAIEEIISVLKPDDFYKEGHRILYQGMQDLHTGGEIIDLITLPQYMEGNKKIREFEEIGGSTYLASLIEAVSTSAGIKYHADIVRDQSIRRRVIAAGSRMIESCCQAWNMTDEILESAEQAIYNITNLKTNDFASFDQVVSSGFADIEAASKQEGMITGVPTGFYAFDRLTAGLQPADLIIIAARPSMGKTALALKMAYNIASKEGKGVAIFSLEMNQKALAMRLFSIDAH